MSRRHQIHADLVAAIARGDADQTRRLITGHSLPPHRIRTADVYPAGAAPLPAPGCVPDDGNHSPFCQSAGRLASMTASTSGSSGVVRGRNRAATVPSGRTRNFSKFHWMSPASPFSSGTAVSSV